MNRCYDSGDIHAYTNVDTAQLGGIAGSGIKSSLVSNCAVMASKITGGTSQFIISGTGTKENNIAYNGLSVKNNATERYAINDFYGNDLYKSKLQWDFSSIWKSVADDFPVLQPINHETDNNAQIVDQAAEQVKIKFAKGDSYDRVTQNVTLEGASNGASVTWSSNREEIVSSMTGAVHRRSDDYQIRVTATISSGNYSVEKRFILNVIGTENSEAVVAEEWAMNLDDARQFVSLMNKCKFKDVDMNDPDVLMLTGNNVDDDAIAETMAKVMTFWEVPEENAYLKSKMGNVLEMIKNGQDKVLKELVRDLGDGWVDCSTGSAQLNKKNVLKNILKIPCKLFNIQQDFVQGYEIMKQSSDFKLSGSPYDDGWNSIKKVGKVIDYIVKTVKGIESSPIISGSISGTIGTLEKIHECIKLYGAYKDAEKNAVKAYLHTYMNIRDGYDSPDDPVFQTLMASHIATSIRIKDENISEMAEQIYRINKKFSSGLSDQYKITIKCPVDIAVYDNSGKIVGRVINNEIDNTIPNSILITLGGKNNDEKTLHFQDEENYNILLAGNDTGSMDIDVESQASDNVTVYTYNDIELNKGKEMTLDVSYGNYSEDMKEFPVISMIDENGAETKTVKALDSVKKEYRLSVYSCIEEADGKITLTNDGGYCISNYTSTGVKIKSLIHVNKGYKLEGLYLDDQCQKQFSESVMTDKALILYAKFIKTGATTAGDDETDAEHFYEDYSNTIKVTNATIQVYANGGKVHIAGSTKKKDSRKCTVYTNILASYKNTLNNKGIVKPAVGKVVVGITKFNVKPEVNSKNKITDTSASSIAKAKIKNGQITVTAVGKEGGLVYLWVIDTGNKGVSASCPINVKLAPNKLEVQDTAGSKLTNTKLANGNTLEVCVAGLVGLTKTDDCTYTATVDSKYKSYITVTPVDGSTNKFTIKAIGFKNDKDTKAVVIFKCDQNGKKTNFSLTVTK